MSDYRLDILGKINLSDYSKIHDYMGVVGENDKFTVTFNKENKEVLKIIYNMLNSNNFHVCSKGGNTDGKLYITAAKIKRQ